MIGRMCRAFCTSAAIAVCCPHFAFSAECPSSRNRSQVFDVNVENASATEVYRLDNGDTRTLTHFAGGATAEQIFYRGLVQTEHFDSGRRTTFTPTSDLAALFPLKIGQSHRVDFNVQTADGKKSVLHAQYKVVDKDHLVIGACRYDVFKIEHSNSFREGPLQFIDTDWYAPDIRLILAREYKRSNGESVIHKYTRLNLHPAAN